MTSKFPKERARTCPSSAHHPPPLARYPYQGQNIFTVLLSFQERALFFLFFLFLFFILSFYAGKSRDWNLNSLPTRKSGSFINHANATLRSSFSLLRRDEYRVKRKNKKKKKRKREKLTVNAFSTSTENLRFRQQS